jgi:hypothetical protein
MKEITDKKTTVINMRISKEKKAKLKFITETLQTTRSQLLEKHIDSLISLYQ